MYEQNTKKNTKIVATISDRKCDVDFLKELYLRGMNVVRINTAHQTVDDAKKVIDNVREVSEKIAVLIDTKGPEIRCTKPETPLTLKEGEHIFIGDNPEESSTEKCIHINYDGFVSQTPKGATILIDDGAFSLRVLEKKDDVLVAQVVSGGTFKDRKTIAVPGVHYDLPPLTEKDKEFIEFAAKQEVAFIAHSFVRNRADVMAVQELLDKHNSTVQIIAKIENQEGVDNIDEILECTFGIMVARGDLGVEIPGHKVPSIQKTLIRKARDHQRVVIVATQMLHTMIENPRPTRAEITDVATAIYDRADAIMLSGETAYGSYPLDSVEMMTSIAHEVEAELATRKFRIPLKEAYLIPEYLALMSMHASLHLDAKAVVVDTTFGTTPRRISAFKGSTPIFSFCYNWQTVRQLALCRGIYAAYMEPVSSSEEFVRKAMKHLQRKETLADDDRVVVIAGNFEPTHGASFIEISTVKNLRRDLAK